MPFWRREETLNERLAKEAGLSLDGELAETRESPPPEPAEPEEAQGFVGRMVQPLADLAAIHGFHRAREWDAVATVEAPGIEGDAVHFLALPAGDLVVDEDVPDEPLSALAGAVEATLAPPYRAEAIRRDGDTWAIGARRTQLVALRADLEGDDLELVVAEGERSLSIDGIPARMALPALEELAGAHGASFVARASRVDDRLWEVEVFPL
jgi:hypothetical protein